MDHEGHSDEVSDGNEEGIGKWSKGILITKLWRMWMNCIHVQGRYGRKFKSTELLDRKISEQNIEGFF
jgi:hypothetical protein